MPSLKEETLGEFQFNPLAGWKFPVYDCYIDDTFTSCYPYGPPNPIFLFFLSFLFFLGDKKLTAGRDFPCLEV